jgi:ATP-dependent RNA helicase DeaD
LEFNRLINYYQEADDIEAPQEGKNTNLRSERNDRGGRQERRSGNGASRSEKGYARLFINLGKMDGLGPQNVIGLLNDNVQGKKVTIGRIDLLKNFSFFEVTESDKDRVIESLDGIKAFGRKVAVEQAVESSPEDRKRKPERSSKPEWGAKPEWGGKPEWKNDSKPKSRFGDKKKEKKGYPKKR